VDVVFRRAARLIAFDSVGRVVLFQYEDHRGSYWATPGGGLDDGEDFAAAAVREAGEELGAAEVVLLQLWDQITEFEARGRPIRQFEQFFLVTNGVDPGVVSQQVDEHHREGIKAVRWWTVEELRCTAEQVFPEDLASRLVALREGLLERFA
jgi:8-oxo-dGTP pyrophosphatase MutT (NUDIX family)